MTEIGHGSNVRQIETTAIYNHDTQTFTLHSPSWNAGKTYIGNAARDGEMATVFAQLKIKGMWKGVHAFLVPIRTPEKDLKRGVFIEDNGQKIGLNGVDNGMIWFDHVTLPKDALLDRFASIDEYGEWSSPIDGDAKRFFTMLGTLVGGRISIAGTSVKATQKALTISTLYAHRRRQFGRDGESESLIIDYPTHQKRIGEGLATTIALSIAIQNLAETNARGSASRDIETRAAALKAYSTWESMRIVQNCREACGGEGYMWKNQIGSIKADMDIFTTFEGDNTVLMQLACKGLLKKLAARFQSGELSISKVVLNELRGQLRKITVPGQRTNWHNLTTIGDLLLARENDLTLTLAQEMRKQKKQGLDNHDIMLDHQIDMIEVSTAYAERLTYQSMVGRYIELKDSRTDQETLTLWKTLTISFGLERILRNPQWFYNENHLNKETQKSASITLKTTYQKIAENSTDIVNAFGIPENAMTAPIAK